MAWFDESMRVIREINRIQSVVMSYPRDADDELVWKAMTSWSLPEAPTGFVNRALEALFLGRHLRDYGAAFAMEVSLGMPRVFGAVRVKQGVIAANAPGWGDISAVIGRFAVEKALDAMGLHFPEDLGRPEGLLVVLDLLRPDQRRLAKRLRVPASFLVSGDAGSVALEERGQKSSVELFWAPRKVWVEGVPRSSRLLPVR